MIKSETGCCPRFDPKPWDGKVFTWKDKKFVKDRIFTLFYMPMNFGSVITKLWKKIEAAGAEMPDYMSLSDHTSMFNMDIYVAVDRKIPDAENVTISGKFLSKVYEGPYQDTGKWCKDFEAYAKSKNLSIRKWYMWYTTCPNCAKYYGKNYVAIIAKVLNR
ncbi:hypothetical protein H0O02_02010 [Candidatus Micrarchaeota archaeon]|nr:hypothetical protein [Candidatus Micrarchaeota archaeon]